MLWWGHFKVVFCLIKVYYTCFICIIFRIHRSLVICKDWQVILDFIRFLLLWDTFTHWWWWATLDWSEYNGDCNPHIHYMLTLASLKIFWASTIPKCDLKIGTDSNLDRTQTEMACIFYELIDWTVYQYSYCPQNL